MPLISLLISLGLLGGLSFWFWRKTNEDKLLRYTFWPALVLRLLCGIVLGIIYQHNYLIGGDSIKYQLISNLITDISQTDFEAFKNILFHNIITDPEILKTNGFPTYTNSFFLVKVLAILNFLTNSNYVLNGLFLSFFSFAGSWFLTTRLSRIFPGAKLPALVALMFFPSVVFWNSGVLKDGVLLGTLGFFWGSVLQLAYERQGKILPGVLVVIAGLLLWKIKYFVAAFVFALTGSWFFLYWAYNRFVFFRKGYFRWLVIPVIIGLVIFVFSLLHYKFNLPFLLMSLVLNYQLFLAKSASKPVIDLEGMEPTLISIISNIPEALFGVLFRPFIGEGDTIFYHLASLENLILLLLFIGALLSFRKFKLTKYPAFYLVLLAYSLCLAVAFGLSTPNLGSLNRYRTAFLPFLVFLLLETPIWRRFLSRVQTKIKELRA